VGKSWIKDRKRRKKTGVPNEVRFQTKAEIALDQVRRARERGIPQGVVLADAGYGTDTYFRIELTKLGLDAPNLEKFLRENGSRLT
jgi:SRSO17 transposase